MIRPKRMRSYIWSRVWRSQWQPGVFVEGSSSCPSAHRTWVPQPFSSPSEPWSILATICPWWPRGESCMKLGSLMPTSPCPGLLLRVPDSRVQRPMLGRHWRKRAGLTHPINTPKEGGRQKNEMKKMEIVCYITINLISRFLVYLDAISSETRTRNYKILLNWNSHMVNLHMHCFPF